MRFGCRALAATLRRVQRDLEGGAGLSGLRHDRGSLWFGLLIEPKKVRADRAGKGRIRRSNGFDVSELFYNLGRRLGRAAIPAIRKTKWIYDGLAGNEDEAIRAEVKLGSASGRRTARQNPGSARSPRSLRWSPDCASDWRRVCAISGARFTVKRSRTSLRTPWPCREGLSLSATLWRSFASGSPDELAFVIGHEMGHIVRRHAWDRMLNGAMFRVASVVGARAGVMGGWLRQNGREALQSAHSRERELEADEFGLRVAVAARFAPEGAICAIATH